MWTGNSILRITRELCHHTIQLCYTPLHTKIYSVCCGYTPSVLRLERKDKVMKVLVLVYFTFVSGKITHNRICPSLPFVREVFSSTYYSHHPQQGTLEGG